MALPDRKLVEAAEAGGRQVHVWTVNDPDHMARLLDVGVHALITDRPDLLKQLLVARGEWTVAVRCSLSLLALVRATCADLRWAVGGTRCRLPIARFLPVTGDR